MKVETLEQYYVEELQDLYDAEKQLLKALPRMAKAACHQELKTAFERHAAQTEEQANRLERILQKHGKNGRGRKCKAMMGLIAEGQEMMSEKPLPEIMDVSLITTAQKVEHYEIAGYGCTTAYAKILGFKDEAALLYRTLVEEKETDTKLTKLAKSIVNPDAAEPEEEEAEARPRRGTAATRGQSKSQARARIGAKSGSTAKSRTSSRKSARSSGRAKQPKRQQNADQGGEAKSTKDLEEIRAWAEARGGTPVKVCGTGNENDPGVLRIDFPGYSGGDSLEPISWEEWYQKFQDNNLTFLYQDQTKDGRESRFFKLVCMEGEQKK